MQLNGFPKHAHKIDKNWLFNNLSIYKINKLYHGKCFVRFFIHSLSRIRKLTRSLRSLARFLLRLNSWIRIVRAHFPWSNLYLLSSASQDKVQELEQMKKEFEEKRKQEKKSEFESKILKYQPVVK